MVISMSFLYVSSVHVLQVFSHRESLLKVTPIFCSKGSKVTYCLGCLLSLVEQVRCFWSVILVINDMHAFITYPPHPKSSLFIYSFNSMSGRTIRLEGRNSVKRTQHQILRQSSTEQRQGLQTTSYQIG